MEQCCNPNLMSLAAHTRWDPSQLCRLLLPASAQSTLKHWPHYCISVTAQCTNPTVSSALTALDQDRPGQERGGGDMCLYTRQRKAGLSEYMHVSLFECVFVYKMERVVPEEQKCIGDSALAFPEPRVHSALLTTWILFRTLCSHRL